MGGYRRLVRAAEGIREALEEQNRLKALELEMQGVQTSYSAQASAAQDPVHIADVDTQLAADMANIEMGLAQTLGRMPTEDEILKAYDAEHKEPDDPRRLSEIEAHLYGRGSHG